jgi:hypothetical protein
MLIEKWHVQMVNKQNSVDKYRPALFTVYFCINYN